MIDIILILHFFTGWHGRLSPRGNIVDRGKELFNIEMQKVFLISHTCSLLTFPSLLDVVLDMFTSHISVTTGCGFGHVHFSYFRHYWMWFWTCSLLTFPSLLDVVLDMFTSHISVTTGCGFGHVHFSYFRHYWMWFWTCSPLTFPSLLDVVLDMFTSHISIITWCGFGHVPFSHFRH